MSKGNFRLEGKVALITGAGSGVGRAMAKLFSQEGAKVIVIDVVPERVKQVVDEINGGASGQVRDLASQSEVEKMVGDALSSAGRIDILCNNAGIMDGFMPVADTSDDLWKKILDVNLNAPFFASRKVIPSMLSKNGGVILNTASIASLFGGRAGAAYTVSKHALIGLTKSIAAEYGDKGIRCNAMILGAVQTNIGMGSSNPSPLGLELLKKASAAMPRMADPMEIARLGLFLSSNEASFMNGSCVVIDNGWTVY